MPIVDNQTINEISYSKNLRIFIKSSRNCSSSIHVPLNVIFSLSKYKSFRGCIYPCSTSLAILNYHMAFQYISHTSIRPTNNSDLQGILGQSAAIKRTSPKKFHWVIPPSCSWELKHHTCAFQKSWWAALKVCEISYIHLPIELHWSTLQLKRNVLRLRSWARHNQLIQDTLRGTRTNFLPL